MGALFCGYPCRVVLKDNQEEIKYPFKTTPVTPSLARSRLPSASDVPWPPRSWCGTVGLASLGSASTSLGSLPGKIQQHLVKGPCGLPRGRVHRTQCFHLGTLGNPRMLGLGSETKELLHNYSGAYTTARTVKRSAVFELSMHCQRRWGTAGFPPFPLLELGQVAVQPEPSGARDAAKDQAGLEFHHFLHAVNLNWVEVVFQGLTSCSENMTLQQKGRSMLILQNGMAIFIFRQPEVSLTVSLTKKKGHCPLKQASGEGSPPHAIAFRGKRSQDSYNLHPLCKNLPVRNNLGVRAHISLCTNFLVIRTTPPPPPWNSATSRGDPL